MKKRLDLLMVERALAPSREKAKAYIMSGDVYVDGQKEDKAGTMFQETVKIEVRGNTLPYVSRGGLKLEKAMNHFEVTLDGKVCMDVGASTGGFTDCMLQNGAVKVYSIDVGYGQLDWKLRNDPRVVCMEKTNIRYVVPEDLQEPADFSSIDVSFISLTKVLLPVRNLLTENGEIVCLIKPQFEAGREKVGKKGVVRDPAVHLEVIEKVIAYAITFSITSRCTAGSRTTPFFPTFSLPASNCGLIRHTISPFSVRRFLTGRRTLVREIKDTSMEEKSAGS